MAADLYLREVDILRFELSMNQCSDAVWAMATEIMEAHRKKDDTVDAVTEKLQMFSHVTDTEGQSLADGEHARGRQRVCRGGGQAAGEKGGGPAFVYNGSSSTCTLTVAALSCTVVRQLQGTLHAV
jgi:hypothetical protein